MPGSLSHMLSPSVTFAVHASRESSAGAVRNRWVPEKRSREEQSGGRTGDGTRTRVVEAMEERRRVE